MNRADLTEKILDIKREKGWKWKTICEKIGGFSDTLIVGALLGQMKLTKPQAGKAAELFGLSKSEEALLNEVPMRGTGTPMPPTDPLIYRFYEMVMINGPAWKQLIEEEFGDGIMSAIDFDFQMERVANPKGDRVKITMSGKFLPYKYYGASGNVGTPVANLDGAAGASAGQESADDDLRPVRSIPSRAARPAPDAPAAAIARPGRARLRREPHHACASPRSAKGQASRSATRASSPQP